MIPLLETFPMFKLTFSGGSEHLRFLTELVLQPGTFSVHRKSNSVFTSYFNNELASNSKTWDCWVPQWLQDKRLTRKRFVIFLFGHILFCVNRLQYSYPQFNVLVLERLNFGWGLLWPIRLVTSWSRALLGWGWSWLRFNYFLRQDSLNRGRIFTGNLGKS